MATDDLFEYEDDDLEALLGEEEGLEGAEWEEDELFGEEGFGEEYELGEEFEEEYEMDELLKGVGKRIAARVLPLIRRELRRRGVTGRALVAAARRILACVLRRVSRSPTAVFRKSVLLRIVVQCVARVVASRTRSTARKRVRAA